MDVVTSNSNIPDPQHLAALLSDVDKQIDQVLIE